jgi:prevent-host-death family protein
MPRLVPTEDVRPLSEFRAHAAAFVEQVRGTKRPMILTQHGRSAAVLLDVGAYEALVEQAELVRDVQLAESQIRRGKGRPHGQARKDALARLRR